MLSARRAGGKYLFSGKRCRWKDVTLRFLHYIEIKLFKSYNGRTATQTRGENSKKYRAATLRLAEYGTFYRKK